MIGGFGNAMLSEKFTPRQNSSTWGRHRTKALRSSAALSAYANPATTTATNATTRTARRRSRSRSSGASAVAVSKAGSFRGGPDDSKRRGHYGPGAPREPGGILSEKVTSDVGRNL